MRALPSSYSHHCISQAQAIVITITLVPELHILLPRHFTRDMALLALLVQGGSGSLNGSHITMCLALLQADLWRRSSAGAFCSTLLLQTVVPPSQLPSFLTKAPRYTEQEIMSIWLVAGNIQHGLATNCFPLHSPFRSTCSRSTQRPTHWQSEIPWKTLPTYFHHPQHSDWLLMASLAPTNLLPGQMPCVV